MSDPEYHNSTNSEYYPFPGRDASSSRRNFFHLASVTVVKAALVTVPVSAMLAPTVARAQSNEDITNALNFLLKLEYLKDELYRLGLEASGLIPEADRAVFAQAGKQEAAHVTFLQGLLGFAAIPKPEFDFTADDTYPDAFTNYTTFLLLAQTLTDTGLRACKGQISNFKNNKDLFRQIVQFHSVDARHAAAVRWLRAQTTGQAIKPWIEYNEPNGAPTAIYNGEETTQQNGINVESLTAIQSISLGQKTAAFDEPLTRDQINEIVNPFKTT